MSEERPKLLDAIRDAARAEESDALSDPRWDALARGELSAEERAELEALAEGDPSLAGAPEAFAPLDEVTRQRFFQAAKHGARSGAGARAGADEGAPGKVSGSETSGARPAPRSLGRRLFLGTSASAVVAVAAGATLWWRFGRRRGEVLPLYELSVAGGARAVRDDAPGEVKLAPGSRVVLSLRPQRSVKGAVEARAFLVQGSARVALEGGMLQQSADGSLKLIARVPSDVAFAPGKLDVVVALGRPGVMGADVDPAGAVEGEGEGVQWTRASVELVRR